MLTQERSRAEAEKTRAALTVLLQRDFDGEVTCEKCEVNDRCADAFDLYNTEGDCLALK